MYVRFVRIKYKIVLWVVMGRYFLWFRLIFFLVFFDWMIWEWMIFVIFLLLFKVVIRFLLFRMLLCDEWSRDKEWFFSFFNLYWFVIKLWSNFFLFFFSFGCFFCIMCDNSWFCSFFSVIVKLMIVILMYIFGRKCGLVKGVFMYNWKLLLYLILVLLINMMVWFFCCIVFLFRIGLSDGFKFLFKFCKKRNKYLGDFIFFGYWSFVG